jgi:methylamine dehydrogenase accessory protein MauD
MFAGVREWTYTWFDSFGYPKFAMASVLLSGRMLLCLVFLAAGLGKLRDRTGSRQSMIDFGMPEALAGAFGTGLPVVEIVVAIALLPASFAWLGAWGALMLLALFTTAMGIALAHGRKPECHCFGQLSSKPIGWGLMSRNGTLAVISALVIYHGPSQPRFLEWFVASDSGGVVFPVLVLVCIGLLLFQNWLIFQLIQQGGRVLLRLDVLEKAAGSGGRLLPPPGLPVGTPAPEFNLDDISGSPQSLKQLRTEGKPVLLLFTNPGCGPCAKLLPEAAAWQNDYGLSFRLVLVSEGSASENHSTIEPYKLHTVLLQRKRETAEAYQSQGTPAAVLVRPDGKVGSALAKGAEAIRALVSDTINESIAGQEPIKVEEGATVPPLVYPSLDSKMISLSQMRGKPAILLFWNPDCGFCQRMAGDVKAWERKADKNAPQLLIISSGTAEQNLKLGFRSPVVLDHNLSTRKVFGVNGTPSALILDAQGTLISGVAAGREQILGSILSNQTAAAARQKY